LTEVQKLDLTLDETKVRIDEERRTGGAKDGRSGATIVYY